jgi:hypothetical protein
MIRGNRCSTILLRANLGAENRYGHHITFSESTHLASTEHAVPQQLSTQKALTCDDAKVNGIVQEAKGNSRILQFAVGHWQDAARKLLLECKDVATAPPNPTAKISSDQTWSLEPQPDGTLRGAETITFPSGCGLPPVVLEYPFVATRVSDLPPSVIVADPTLF